MREKENPLMKRKTSGNKREKKNNETLVPEQ